MDIVVASCSDITCSDLVQCSKDVSSEDYSYEDYSSEESREDPYVDVGSGKQPHGKRPRKPRNRPNSGSFKCAECREESMYEPYVCKNCYKGTKGNEQFSCSNCKFGQTRAKPFICQSCEGDTKRPTTEPTTTKASRATWTGWHTVWRESSAKSSESIHQDDFISECHRGFYADVSEARGAIWDSLKNSQTKEECRDECNRNAQCIFFQFTGSRGFVVHTRTDKPRCKLARYVVRPTPRVEGLKFCKMPGAMELMTDNLYVKTNGKIVKSLHKNQMVN